MRLRHVLVVFDERHGGYQLLRCAALVAGSTGARVRLVCHRKSTDGRPGATAQDDVVERLEHRATPLRAGGIDVTLGVIGDAEDGHEAIVRQALRCGCDLIVKHVDTCGRLAAVVRAHPDRRLLRSSPCPVWLVDEQRWPSGPVLAAINPQEGDEFGAALDARVLAAASAIAEWLDTSMHVVHAWSVPLMPLLGRTPCDRWRNWQAIEVGMGAAAARVARCVAYAPSPLPRRRIHIARGDVGTVLPEVATAIGAQVLVAGNVARAGLAAALHRTVAERVLADMRCSLFVVTIDPARVPVPLHAPLARRRLRPAH